MPHQCLKCGKIFEEGSVELLKGCPACDGNHFFYTKEPLGEEERKVLTERLGKDITSTVTDLIGGQARSTVGGSGNWINIKPKNILEAMEKRPAETKKVTPDSKENIDIITDAGYRKEIIEKIETESTKSTVPETIDIDEPGKYRIDIKGLLEEEPIIIQKDGSYTIHLPSVFKMIDKEKKE